MIIIAVISFLASAAGAISGIGGGVIIKPVLDMAHILSVGEISFLSGCTVLSMTTVSVVKSLCRKEDVIDVKRATPLAMGAAFGGIAGKLLFSAVARKLGNDSFLGLVQAVLMLFMTAGTLLYLRLEGKIHTLHLENMAGCMLAGMMLGVLSAFLGIGGGPANLVVLSFFFSMERKKASVNSLYIIFFSQLFSLAAAFAERTVPDAGRGYLLLMVIAGMLGGITGGHIYRKITAAKINAVFSWMLVLLILINLWNILRFSGLISVIL